MSTCVEKRLALERNMYSGPADATAAQAALYQPRITGIMHG